MKKEYLQYNAADFLEDDLFIQWMKGEKEAAGLWETWLEQHPEKLKEVRTARSLYSTLSTPEKTRDDINKDELWAKIRSETTSSSEKQDQDNSLKWRNLLPYAAVFALLIWATIYFWPSDPSNYYETGLAEMQKWSLPDNSEVVLNAQSTLHYQQTDTSRLLQLSGEGYFDVKEGKAFSVESPQGIVTVLGTAFNIYDREGVYEVVCASGKVRVQLKKNGSFLLTKGEFVRLTADGKVETNDDSGDLVNTEAWIAWTEGEFFFPDANLNEVMQEVERQFDVNVHLPEEFKEIKGAYYFTNEDLDQALENILWPLRLSFEKDGKDIYIKKDDNK